MDDAIVNHGTESHSINEKCNFCDMVRREFNADFARFNWDVVDFLRESNNIENEWDDLSLQQAIFAWDYLMGEKQLTPSVILKVHKLLMLHQDTVRPDQTGYFRREPVWIAGREGKPWFVVPELITNWCKSVEAFMSKVDVEKEDAESAIKEHHLTYERIHPFADGNGRTGRIFLNWERVKLGLPVLVIREKEKEAYYEWFE